MTHNPSRLLPGVILAATAFLSFPASGLPLPTVTKPIDPVETDGGLIAGKVLDSGVRAWFGVPYAQAPVRDLRWRGPQRLSWSGVFNADRFAPQCIQPLRGSNINHYFGHEATSEDCLYLNIWAPADSGAGDDRPVIVWIYGGGFTIGSAAMRNYAGENLAKKGAVYISIAYRVGALGFLAHPELTAESPQHASGNYGFLDQVAALEWIQRNIRKFGGDPERVTIMGQSAGSASTSSLQVSPIARGLFHRIVGMSGSSVVDRFRSTLKEAEQTGLQYEEALGVDSIAALRHISADKILAQQQDCQLGCAGTIRVGPTIDGYFMSDEPSKVFARGEQIDVPIMVGFTRDEGFSAIGGARTLDQYQGFLQEAYGDKAEELFRLYPATTDAEARRAARDVARDSTLGLSMYVWAELQTAHGDAPAFSYQFARVHPYTEGVKFADHDPATVGAYHTADVPYWLQTLDSLNLYRETRTYTDYDRRLSDLMSDAIVAFAEKGDPSTEDLGWPQFSSRNPQLVQLGLETDKLFQVRPWPNAEKLQFFKDNVAKPISSANVRRDPRD
ncbi:MAG TPA: carboxylesterase family protein [Woeseiaceae bacterium]|nr:carboxylesterase family protein [Woeseiaceae bacterium]